MSSQVLRWLVEMAGVLGICVGLVLIVLPPLLRQAPYLSHWLFRLDMLRALNRYHAIERLVYRHHRTWGLTLIAAATFWIWQLYRLDADYHLAPIAEGLLGYWGSKALFLIGGLLPQFVLVIGLFLLLRPSAIKGFEAAANRWIDPYPFDGSAEPSILLRAVLKWPRLTGLMLLTGGSACLFASSMGGHFGQSPFTSL